MAISTFDTPYYLSVNCTTDWDLKSNTLAFYQLQEGTNEIGIYSTSFSGQLEINPFTVTLQKPVTSIELMWNQWNCGTLPTDMNLIYQVSIYVVSLGRWINFLPVSRASFNGTKVALDLPDVILPGEYQIKFTLSLDKNGGYNPRTEEDLYIFFNYQTQSKSVYPPQMVVNASLKDATITATDKRNASVAPGVMQSSVTMHAIEKMNSWDGNHATINTNTFKAASRLLNVAQVFGTGDLSPIIEPDPFKLKGILQEPYVKDQELAEIVCEDLILQKEIDLGILSLQREIELEVESYDI